MELQNNYEASLAHWGQVDKALLCQGNFVYNQKYPFGFVNRQILAALSRRGLCVIKNRCGLAFGMKAAALTA